MFSDMLKYLRKREGLTQEQLAKALNVSRGRISMYEIGQREPDFETLEAIADFFNVNMSVLLGKSEKSAKDDGLSEYEERFIQMYRAVPDQNKESAYKAIESILLALQGNDGAGQ